MIDARALLNRTDLVALIGETIRLTKRGAEHYGICPFHADKAPTLRVNGKKGFWLCPACQIGGDALSWLDKHDGLRFREAAAELARRAGITLDQARDETPAPLRARFPHPEHEPATPWGGQHLMAGDGRPVYVFNDFPGRRRYLQLAEQHPGVDLLWWPREGITAERMYLAPIARCVVRTEPWGLWEAYRAAGLIDAIAGWRLQNKVSLDAGTHDALLLEAGRIEGWIAHFMAGRAIAPGTNQNSKGEAGMAARRGADMGKSNVVAA